MNQSDLMVGSRTPFQFNVSSGVLAANATSTIPLTLDPQRDFELHAIVGTSNADVKTQVANNYFSVIISQINGQQWSTLGVLHEQISPQSNQKWPPGNLPVILPAKFQMQFAFLDLGTGGTHYVALVGFLLGR